MAYLGEDIPKLGFGLMRLPLTAPDPFAPVDMDELKAMVDLFMENGFSYFDTAYGYQNSEAAIKEALVDRYPRESFQIATKLPAWAGAKSKEEAEQMYYTSMERLGVDYLDFYLLHNVSEKHRWAFDGYEMWDFMKKLKAEGKVKHIGMSFHDHADYLDGVLTEHPEMEFVQIQANYVDWEDPVVESRRCAEVCAKHGVPIVIMEPLRGGKLCNLPEKFSHYLTDVDPDASLASWGLRFATQLPNLLTVLSGMSNLEQMRENIEILQNAKPLTETEREALADVAVALSQVDHVPCTDCRYCMKDCPVGIPIPSILDAYNSYLVYGDLGGAKFSYGFWTDMHGAPRGSACVQCGACERVCTQHINVVEELAKATALLEG